MHSEVITIYTHSIKHISLSRRRGREIPVPFHMHVKSMHTCRKYPADAMDGRLEIADDRIVGKRYRMIFKRVIVSHCYN